MLDQITKHICQQELCLNTPDCKNYNCLLFHKSKQSTIPELQFLCQFKCGTEEGDQNRVQSQNTNKQEMLSKNNELERETRNLSLCQHNHRNESNIDNKLICLDIIFIIYKEQNLEEWIGQISKLEVIFQYFNQIKDNPCQLRLGAIFQLIGKNDKIQLSSNVSDFLEMLKSNLSNIKQAKNDIVKGKQILSLSNADEDLTEVLRAACQLKFCYHPDSILKLILLNQHFQLETLLNQENKKKSLQIVLNLIKTQKENFQFSICSSYQNNDIIIKNNKIDGLDYKFINSEEDFQKYLQQEIDQSLVKIKKNHQEQKQRIQANFQEQNEKPFNYVEGIFIKYIDDQIKDTKIDGNTNLYIDKQQMGNEQNNNNNNDLICFKAYDEYHKINVILKIPSFIVNSQGDLSQEVIKRAEQLAQDQYKQQYITVLLLNSFNEKLKKPQLNQNIMNSIPQVYGAKPFIFNLSISFLGLKIIYGEIFLQGSSQWQTYANFSQEDHAMSALSHYSYFKTKQQLIITSIQGKGNLLCKPKISFESTAFDNFYKIQHTQCNSVCKTVLELESQNYKVMQLKFKENYFLCNFCNRKSLSDKVEIPIYFPKSGILESSFNLYQRQDIILYDELKKKSDESKEKSDDQQEKYDEQQNLY